MNRIAIYILKAHPQYSYFTGQTYDVPVDQAKFLILNGNAREATPVLPLDLPARDTLINNGIETVAELRKISDLTKLKGIGKKTAEAITAYLSIE
jgi:hypothetical protein